MKRASTSGAEPGAESEISVTGLSGIIAGLRVCGGRRRKCRQTQADDVKSVTEQLHIVLSYTSLGRAGAPKHDWATDANFRVFSQAAYLADTFCTTGNQVCCSLLTKASA